MAWRPRNPPQVEGGSSLPTQFVAEVDAIIIIYRGSIWGTTQPNLNLPLGPTGRHSSAGINVAFLARTPEQVQALRWVRFKHGLVARVRHLTA